jgi:hypothetical protein
MPVLTLEGFKEKSLQLRIDTIGKTLPHMQVLEESFLEDNDFPRLAKVKGMISDLEDELEEASHGYERWIKYHRKSGTFQGQIE